VVQAKDDDDDKVKGWFNWIIPFVCF